MSAQYSAPGLGRVQVATPGDWTAPQGSSISTGPRPARVTRRAMAVAAATLCAPMVAAAALAAIGAAGGGNHAEMGTLAGTQGLRGTTVAATSPAPPEAPAPTAVSSEGKGDVTLVAGKGRQVRPSTHDAQSSPTPEQGSRPPIRREPTRPAPKQPAPKVTPNPPTRTTTPTYDPSGPGAPTTAGSTGGTDTSGSNSGSSSGPGSADGYSGGD
jgi:hypothetical protein